MAYLDKQEAGNYVCQLVKANLLLKLLKGEQFNVFISSHFILKWKISDVMVERKVHFHYQACANMAQNCKEFSAKM
jgi:hypothetical protein